MLLNPPYYTGAQKPAARILLVNDQSQQTLMLLSNPENPANRALGNQYWELRTKNGGFVKFMEKLANKALMNATWPEKQYIPLVCSIEAQTEQRQRDLAGAIRNFIYEYSERKLRSPQP